MKFSFEIKYTMAVQLRYLAVFCGFTIFRLAYLNTGNSSGDNSNGKCNQNIIFI